MSQHYEKFSVSVVSSLLTGTKSSALSTRFKNFRRKDEECRAFVKKVTKSPVFVIIMISAISLNAFLIALGTNYKIRNRLFRVFEVSEILCVSIYACEFLMKVYVDPHDYWKSGYHVLDVIIIIIIVIPYILRRVKGMHYANLNIADGLQSLRILKLIYYSQGIRALIATVGQTVYTTAAVLTLLFVLIYIFGILGFWLFGATDDADLSNWGNLPLAFSSLFSLATVDGWTGLQEELDKKSAMSRVFTIIFILLAYFIFLNMFMAVMIAHTEDSIRKSERELMVKRHVTLLEKQMLLRQQQDEVNRLLTSETNVNKSFTQFVESFKKSLRHTDPMVLDDFGTSLHFTDVYFSTLDHQDATMNKLQELYYEIVNVLSLMLEDLPKKSPALKSDDEK